LQEIFLFIRFFPYILFLLSPRISLNGVSGVGCGGKWGYSWGVREEGSLISIYNQVTKYHNSMFKVFITLWTTTTAAKIQRHTQTQLTRTVEPL